MGDEYLVLRQQLVDRCDAIRELWLELAMAEQWQETRERTITRLIERSKQFTQCRRDRDYWFEVAMEQGVRADNTEAALASCLCGSCRTKLLDGARYSEGTCLHCQGEELEAGSALKDEVLSRITYQVNWNDYENGELYGACCYCGEGHILSQGEIDSGILMLNHKEWCLVPTVLSNQAGQKARAIVNAAFRYYFAVMRDAPIVAGGGCPTVNEDDRADALIELLKACSDVGGSAEYAWRMNCLTKD